MMLCEVMISALVSDPTVWVVLRSLSGLLKGAVDDDESDDRNEIWAAGEFGRGVMSLEGRMALGGEIEGTASLMADDKGSICCFSWIDPTILSSRSGVMCVSFPRLVASNEGCFRVEPC